MLPDCNLMAGLVGPSWTTLSGTEKGGGEKDVFGVTAHLVLF